MAEGNGKDNLDVTETIEPINTNRDISFSTKSVSWYNPVYEKIENSKILNQNENGPCALISIVNCLIMNYKLRADIEQKISEIENLIKFLGTRDRVSLHELVEVLGEIFVYYCKDSSMDQKVYSQLFNLLSHLHEGLNINPNFLTGKISDNINSANFSNINLEELDATESSKSTSIPVTATSEPKDTCTSTAFVTAPEVQVFETFRLPIFHGWVIEPSESLEYKLVSYIENYDAAQNFLIFAETSENDKIIAYKEILNNFLARTSSQLTSYGIDLLKKIVPENQFVIFFRNDHYNVLMKRKVFNETEGTQDYEFYTLVTDEVFVEYQNVVWQELKTVNGMYDSFYDYQLIPVNLSKSDVPGYLGINEDDEDFQLAKQIQEKEDALAASRLQQRHRTPKKPADIEEKKKIAKSESKVEHKPAPKKDIKKSKDAKKKNKDCVIV